MSSVQPISGPGGTLPCIISNPDISGIGVRVAIYIQNLLSFVPAYTVLSDGNVSLKELERLEGQSTTILITALAILISTVIQAHRENGITNYHASIVLNLSWMNNTNLFIYLFLYVFRRANLPEQRRNQEDKFLDDLDHPLMSRVMEAMRDWNKKQFGNRETGVKKVSGGDSGVKDQENRDFSEAQGPKVIGLQQLLWAEKRRILMDPVIIIGSLHLTFMAAVGIWLWSHPAAFGSSNPCTLSASIFVLGINAPLGSKALRIWSIMVYSVLLTPILNLVIPIAFFAIFLGFKHTEKKDPPHIGRYQIVMGLGTLCLIEAILLIDTEVILSKNSHLVGTGEAEWTFGQTLAVLVLLVPLRDLVESVCVSLDLKTPKQKKPLLEFINGRSGKLFEAMGLNQKDLSKIISES
ncbi:hypothetical protein H2248_007757 [Termitomyces sp. 'cryptogamus']|nr:hypothetical protein H2248_007757 [Termitomyces sp. 'cryptogamus']